MFCDTSNEEIRGLNENDTERQTPLPSLFLQQETQRGEQGLRSKPLTDVHNLIEYPLLSAPI